jgi:hypothetical protein
MLRIKIEIILQPDYVTRNHNTRGLGDHTMLIVLLNSIMRWKKYFTYESWFIYSTIYIYILFSGSKAFRYTNVNYVIAKQARS